MNASLFFTDATHKYKEAPLFPSDEPIPYAFTVSFCEEPTVENFLGFGVAVTGSSCYNLSLLENEKRKALLQDLYGSDGLCLSVGRLSIGASDYSPYVYSYCDVKEDRSLKSFSIEKDRAYILPVLHEIIFLRPDLYFIASPWSPPGWMKTSGTMSGGFMRREYIDCYAEYILKFLEAYEKEGIPIAALTVQNECQGDQDGRMPACIWHPDDEADFALVLRKKLAERDKKCALLLLDHNFSNVSRLLYQLSHFPALQEAVNGAAFHYYCGSPSMTEAFRKAFPALDWHFTEGGPRLYDRYDTDWCKWGVIAANSLSHGCKSFTGWNLLLDECGGPNVGPFFCGGLVTLNRETQALSYSGQYRALRHFSRHIQKGASIYAAKPSEDCMGYSSYPNGTEPLGVVAAVNPDGSHTVELVNPRSESVRIQYFFRGKWWYAALPPDSISTLVFSESAS